LEEHGKDKEMEIGICNGKKEEGTAEHMDETEEVGGGRKKIGPTLLLNADAALHPADGWEWQWELFCQ
jgi:hypothetical protein